MADIWLIRHGQAGDVMGDYDKLSDRGKEQSRRAGERWRHIGPIDRVVSGAMRRHRETAAGFAETFGPLPTAAIDPAWNEFDHQTVVRAALAAGMEPDRSAGRAGFFRFFLSAMTRWSDGRHDADYPEAYLDFCARIDDGLQRVTDGLPSGGTALVFTSGGSISSVCKALLGLAPEAAFRINLALVNTGFTRLRAGSGLLSLATLNAHPQFDDAPDLLTHS